MGLLPHYEIAEFFSWSALHCSLLLMLVRCLSPQYISQISNCNMSADYMKVILVSLSGYRVLGTGYSIR